MAANILMMVFVEVKEVGVQEYLVNYSDGRVKEWLEKTTVWAMSNGGMLKMRTATEQERSERRRFKPKESSL